MKTKGAHWAQFHQRSTYSFYTSRSRMRKTRQSSQPCHLALLGPTSVKAAHKPLMKSTPVANFINVKRSNFSYKRHFCSIYYVHVTRKKLPKWRSYTKCTRLMLMKLTPGLFGIPFLTIYDPFSVKTKTLIIAFQIKTYFSFWE